MGKYDGAPPDIAKKLEGYDELMVAVKNTKEAPNYRDAYVMLILTLLGISKEVVLLRADLVRRIDEIAEGFAAAQEALARMDASERDVN
jgi:hypothetical protein